MDAGLSGLCFSGRGRAEARPQLGCRRSWGEGESGAPPWFHALPSATATKWVPWPDFTRIKTLRLPSL